MKVEINKEQLEDTTLMLKGLSLDGPKIISRTLNKTASKGRTRSAQEIRKQIKLKSSYVKQKLKVHRATRNHLRARISANQRGLLLMNFVSGVDNKERFNIKVKPRGRAKKLEGAFLTSIYAGGRKVDTLAFPDDGHYKTGNRRMKVLYGPSVSQVFNKVRDSIDAELMEFLATATEREISAAIRGY